MKNTFKILVTAEALLTMTEAKAFPFTETPEGCADYMNNLSSSWSYGKNIELINPRSCGRGSSGQGNYYSCRFDYIENSQLGTRICINDIAKYYLGDVFWSDNAEECGEWQQPTAISPDSIQQRNTANSSAETSSSFLKFDTSIYNAGAVGLALGVIVGFTVRSITIRRK